jgi:hypothetical protein
LAEAPLYAPVLPEIPNRRRAQYRHGTFFLRFVNHLAYVRTVILAELDQHEVVLLHVVEQSLPETYCNVDFGRIKESRQSLAPPDRIRDTGSRRGIARDEDRRQRRIDRAVRGDKRSHQQRRAK